MRKTDIISIFELNFVNSVDADFEYPHDGEYFDEMVT